MKLLLTGGSGDLGTALTKRNSSKSNHVIRFDIREPSANFGGEFVQGSVLNRKNLHAVTKGVDCIVHIAAWHGFHEFTKEKSAYDFWDLNMTGTFNVFQSAIENNVTNIIYLSSECISDRYGIYGNTKVMGELLAQTYCHRHQMNIIALRAGAFIPYWNKTVYPTNAFIEWAKWYCKGAVHIDDVCQAVEKSCDLLFQEKRDQLMVLDIDGKYEYTPQDIANWDKAGKGSTFNKYYSEYVNILKHYDLDLSEKPTIRDISEAEKQIGYKPTYSLKSLLEELRKKVE